MAKNRMVTKHCPKCEQQVPVACKSCPCGHEFFANRRPRGGAPDQRLPRRRTERVRKERQSYLTALVLEQRAAARAKRARRNSRRGRPPRSPPAQHHDSASDEARKLNRPRCGPAKPTKPIVEPEMPDEEEEDMFAGCTKERLELYAAILADINRKLCSQQFQQQL